MRTVHKPDPSEQDDFTASAKNRGNTVSIAGSATLPSGSFHDADQEIGVPGSSSADRLNMRLLALNPNQTAFFGDDPRGGRCLSG